MRALRFDPEQRFTCQRCSRCCRAGWDIVLTPGEAEAYRRESVARLWSPASASEPLAPPPPAEPVEPVPGVRGAWRLKKRADGSCGFLSAAGLCRIHEALGAAKKPLTCRMFPFRLHPGEGAPLLTTSFSCPTVVANTGATLGSQLKELSALRREWQSAWPELQGQLQWVAGRPVDGATAGTIRTLLLLLLEREGAEGGAADLRGNVARLAERLEDWTRHRVLKLEPTAFAAYVELTGRHAASSPKPVAPHAPSLLGRLLLRGFLLAVLAARLQAREPRRGLRLGLRLRLVRLALHLNGLWPASEGVSVTAARRARLDLEDATVRRIVRHYLRSRVEALPTGRRPMFDDLAQGFAVLDAALALGAMRAVAQARDTLSAEDLSAGLVEAADLEHADAGRLGPLLASLSGGVDALHAFATERPL